MGGNQSEDDQPKVLIHPEDWDYDNMHHDPFNMLRFYLPYLRPFRTIETLFFADDDIMVTQDISLLPVSTLALRNHASRGVGMLLLPFLLRSCAWYIFPVRR